MSQGNMMKFIPVEASKWGEMVQAMTRVKELEEALAKVKAEADQLKADLDKSDGVVWTLSVENDRLKAEVEIQNQRINREDKEVAKLYRENARLKADIERLTKAGDAMVEIVNGTYCVHPPQALIDWHAAKGVQS